VEAVESGAPTACVLGDLDLVAPLVMAGVHCAIVAPPGDPARYSRRTQVAGWAHPSGDPGGLLAVLERYCRSQPAKPVLFYESDQYARFVSEHREVLAEWFCFVIASREQVEDLIDKVRFSRVAEQLRLPVPATRVMAPHGSAPPDCDLPPFPLLIKPATRGDGTWEAVEPKRKAVRVDGRAELEAIWPRLDTLETDVLVQELIPGPETLVESYHTYVDEQAEVVGEFTGRKLRTRPVDYGHSTALTITHEPDTIEAGRQVVDRLGLRGVAKLDFKRTPDGDLRLLEVNPRFSLWHHPGAIAGVNIPALVWADLTKNPRPPVGHPAPGVFWMSPWDVQSARDYGVPLHRWLPWAWRCQAKSMMAWDDPLPFLRLSLQRVRRGLRHR
jgi:predicted ATP-grasp superfamily ATP-dependent carboligase